jgi:hypothetical protein
VVPFTIYFTLEAATLEEAEAAVQTWTVSPGTILQGISGSVSSDLVPVDLAAGGLVADGDFAQRQPIPDPPAEPPPPPDLEEPGA